MKRHYGTPQNYSEMLSQIKTEMKALIAEKRIPEAEELPNLVVDFTEMKIEDYIRNRLTVLSLQDKQIIAICDAILKRE